MSALARDLGVPRETLRDSIKFTERQIERRKEHRGRPRKLSKLQARRAFSRPGDTAEHGMGHENGAKL